MAVVTIDLPIETSPGLGETPEAFVREIHLAGKSGHDGGRKTENSATRPAAQV
jgi:hypothetical protein